MLEVFHTKANTTGPLAMTTSYRRQTVFPALNLVMDHPLPEVVFVKEVKADEVSELMSVRTLPSTVSRNVTLSRVPSRETITLTGYTTEASSEYSVSDDEFDQQMTNQVKTLFEDIDKTLFENAPGPPSLADECDDWLRVFPHLRIVGHQIVLPEKKEDECIPDKIERPSPISTPRSINEPLHINGEPVIVHRPVEYELTDDSVVESSALEEIMEADGIIEEIIVLDSKTDSDDASQYSNKRLKKGPPRKSNGKYNVQGTSRGCLKENITDSVFDYYWSELTDTMKPVINRLRSQVSYEDNQVESEEEVDEDEDDDTIVEEVSRRPTVISMPPAIFGFGGGLGGLPRDTRPPSRDYSTASTSRFTSASHLRRPMSSMWPEDKQLDGLLTISTKLISNRRERSDLSEESTTCLSSSSAIEQQQQQHPFAVRVTDNLGDRVLSGLRPYDPSRYSARQRPTFARGRISLASLSQDDGENALGGRVVLQGKKMCIDQITPPSHTMRSNASPPPQKTLHNIRLPPLSIEPSAAVDGTQSSVVKKKVSPRLGSAVPEKVVHFRDWDKAQSSARPNTSQLVPKAEIIDSSRRSVTSIGFSTSNKSGQHVRGTPPQAPASSHVVAFSGKALKPMVRTNGSSFSNNHASSSQETTLHGKADVLRLHGDTPTQASQNHTGHTSVKKVRQGVGQLSIR